MKGPNGAFLLTQLLGKILVLSNPIKHEGAQSPPSKAQVLQ